MELKTIDHMIDQMSEEEIALAFFDDPMPDLGQAIRAIIGKKKLNALFAAGFVIVPAEPTLAMCRAGAKKPEEPRVGSLDCDVNPMDPSGETGRPNHWATAMRYQAMIEARPK